MTRPLRTPASIARAGIASAVAALVMLVAACGGNSGADPGDDASQLRTIENGYLTIAFQDGGLPRVSKGDGDTLIGTWGYVITKFAEKYNLKLKLMGTDTSGEILAVQNKRADMGAAIYNRPQRRTVVRFLDYDTYDSYYVALPSSVNYTGPSTLDGKTVGIASGFNAVPYLEKHFGASNVKQFKTYALGVQALKNGQIDAYFNTMPLLGLIGRNNPDFAVHSLAPDDYGMPADQVATAEGPVVACGNDELTEAYNAFYREIVKTDEYKKVWSDAWSAVGAPEPMKTMVSEQLPVPNGC